MEKREGEKDRGTEPEFKSSKYKQSLSLSLLLICAPFSSSFSFSLIPFPCLSFVWEKESRRLGEEEGERGKVLVVSQAGLSPLLMFTITMKLMCTSWTNHIFLPLLLPSDWPLHSLFDHPSLVPPSFVIHLIQSSIWPSHPFEKATHHLRKQLIKCCKSSEEKSRNWIV